MKDIMDLYVFPTRELMKQRNCGENDRYTFDVFINRVIADFTAGLTAIGDLEKFFIIYRLMSGAVRKQFKYFKDVKIGYAKAISSLISELKMQGIMPDDLVQLLPRTEKYEDLVLIYSLYNDFLKNNMLYDKEDRYLLAMDNIRDYVKQYDRVIFVDFYDITKIQLNLMAKVDPKALQENDPLISNINRLYVYEAWDRTTEVYNLAHQILKDIKQGLKCEDMAIVIREPALYADYLNSVFKKAGIPLGQDIHEPILRNPFVKGFMGALRGIKNSYFEAFDVPDYHMTFSQWNEYVLMKLQETGYPDRLIDVDTDLEYYKRDIEAYGAVEDFLGKINRISAITGEFVQIGIDRYVDQLKEFLKDMTYCREISRGGISIISPTGMRGLRFKKVYVLGLVEGEYPRAFISDWLIKDDHRRLLNEKGYSLDTLDGLIKRERLTLDYIMASSEEIYVSYPDIIEGNKPSLISDYVSLMAEHSKTVSTASVDFDDVFVYDIGIDVPDTRGVITADLRPIFDSYVFSPTSLEKYIQCPYRFLLGEILCISPAEDNEFNAAVEGSVYHSVLSRFVSNHKNGFEAQDEQKYINEIGTILDEVLLEKGVDRLFDNKRVYQLMRNDMMNTLSDFLKNQLKIWENREYLPYKTEYSFGGNKEFRINNIPFKGFIDRIDRSADGRFVVYDYKKNTTPSFDEVINFENIQLPLYIMAVQQLLGEVMGGGFVSIKKGTVDTILVRDSSLPFAKRKRRGKFTKVDWDKFFEDFARNISEVYNDIISNKFPIQPKRCPKTNAYGAFCEYADICVYEGSDI